MLDQPLRLASKIPQSLERTYRFAALRGCHEPLKYPALISLCPHWRPLAAQANRATPVVCRQPRILKRSILRALRPSTKSNRAQLRISLPPELTARIVPWIRRSGRSLVLSREHVLLVR